MAGSSEPSETGDQAVSGRNAAALEVTISELDRMGRLERIDEAWLQAARSMASALDDRPHSPQMWREYRTALWELISGDDDGTDLSGLLADLQPPARDAAQD